MFTATCLRCHGEARRFKFSLKFFGGKRLRLCPNCCVSVTSAVAACMIEPQVDQLRQALQQRQQTGGGPLMQELLRRARVDPVAGGQAQNHQQGAGLHQNPPQPPPVQQAFDLQFMCRCGSVVNKRIDISKGPHVEHIHCARCENETQVPITPELIQKVMGGGQ